MRRKAHALPHDAIHDAVQVVGYFNYVNWIAGGVGIEGEPDWAGEERTRAGTAGSAVRQNEPESR